MALTEAERHEMHQLAHHELTDRLAELLMQSIPTDPERLATREDLATTSAGVRADMAELRGDMAELRTELKTDMAELRTDLKTEMSELRNELKIEMADLRTEMVGLRADVATQISVAITAQTRTLLMGLVVAIVATNLAALVS